MRQEKLHIELQQLAGHPVELADVQAIHDAFANALPAKRGELSPEAFWSIDYGIDEDDVLDMMLELFQKLNLPVFEQEEMESIEGYEDVNAVFLVKLIQLVRSRT